MMNQMKSTFMGRGYRNANGSHIEKVLEGIREKMMCNKRQEIRCVPIVL